MPKNDDNIVGFTGPRKSPTIVDREILKEILQDVLEDIDKGLVTCVGLFAIYEPKKGVFTNWGILPGSNRLELVAGADVLHDELMDHVRSNTTILDTTASDEEPPDEPA